MLLLVLILLVLLVTGTLEGVLCGVLDARLGGFLAELLLLGVTVLLLGVTTIALVSLHCLFRAGEVKAVSVTFSSELAGSSANHQ